MLRSLYVASREKIAHAPESLIDMPNLHFERENDILLALDLYRAESDFADAQQHAGAAGCDAFATFNRDLVKRAKRRSLMPPIELVRS
jgi:predicted nucleic-acid-binding protein